LNYRLKIESCCETQLKQEMFRIWVRLFFGVCFALVDCRGNADFGTELVADTGVALGDAIDVGFMQRIDFPPPLGVVA